jgi:hypothetical protein
MNRFKQGLGRRQQIGMFSTLASTDLPHRLVAGDVDQHEGMRT